MSREEARKHYLDKILDGEYLSLPLQKQLLLSEAYVDYVTNGVMQAPLQKTYPTRTIRKNYE